MSSRRSIEIPGLQHENPIPVAARIGPFLATSGVFGKDPATGEIPPDIESQCALMFANLRLILAAAGGTPADVLKMTLHHSSLKTARISHCTSAAPGRSVLSRL